MGIHIEFADGSNPYIKFNMEPEEFAKEILRWSKHFRLTYIRTIAQTTVFRFMAEEKRS